MPLLAPVIKAARARRQQIQGALGVAQLAAWRSMLATRWLPLPAGGASRSRDNGHAAGNGVVSARVLNVAVDGTSHSVQLHTGAHFILAVAAAYGPDFCQDERADMEVLPARYDDSQASSARDLLMRSLEAYAAAQAAACIEQAGESQRAVLWIDGSLYADLAHMAGAPEKVRWGGGIERAGHLLRTTAALLDLAERTGLWLVGIGKTQRASFLYDALTATASDTMIPPTADGRRPSDSDSSLITHHSSLIEDGHPADGELLSAMSTGWSWPIVLDGSRFPLTSKLAQETLQASPAIVSTYVRPHPADLPLRIDVPASMIGLEDRLLPYVTGSASRRWPAWVPDPQAMRPVVEAALAAYGGLHVYNAPLYAVDRLVRLPRRELELRYLPICEKIVGLTAGTLAINRGRRRFLIA